jgi:hypothetical protein
MGQSRVPGQGRWRSVENRAKFWTLELPGVNRADGSTQFGVIPMEQPISRLPLHLSVLDSSTGEFAKEKESS